MSRKSMSRKLMSRKLSKCLPAGVISLLTVPNFSFAQETIPPADPKPPSANSSAAFEAQSADRDGQFTVMAQGPLHEAFAEQFSADPTAGIIVPKEPPQPIEELPPKFKPEGDNIAWIPGYWGWDPQEEDYLWISGIWRQLPPNRQWLPGYWTQVDNGFQWISGFWASTQAEEIAYLPSPPPSIDNGPSSNAPDRDQFWVPGNWVYQDYDYAWQAGYWTAGNAEWIWVPSRYVWTPSGCIYRAGYWDYPLANRGTVFCPVQFNQFVPGYQFQPQYVVDLSPAWYANLFVCPSYNHYLYGNYYAPNNYNQSGNFGSRNGNPYNSYSWITYNQNHRGYDPLYNYYAHQGRNNSMIRQIAQLQQYIYANQNVRPARTLTAQRQQYAGFSPQQRSFALQTASISNLAQSNAAFQTPFAMGALNSQLSQQITQSISPIRAMVRERQSLEKANSADDKTRAKIQTDADLAAGDDIGESAQAAAKLQAKRLRLTNKATANAGGKATGESADASATMAAAIPTGLAAVAPDAKTGAPVKSTTQVDANAKDAANSLVDGAKSSAASVTDVADQAEKTSQRNSEQAQRMSRQEIAKRRADMQDKNAEGNSVRRRNEFSNDPLAGLAGGNATAKAGAGADTNGNAGAGGTADGAADAQPNALPTAEDMQQLRRSMLGQARENAATAAGQNPVAGQAGQSGNAAAQAGSNRRGPNSRPQPPANPNQRQGSIGNSAENLLDRAAKDAANPNAAANNEANPNRGNRGMGLNPNTNPANQPGPNTAPGPNNPKRGNIPTRNNPSANPRANPGANPTPPNPAGATPAAAPGAANPNPAPGANPAAQLQNQLQNQLKNRTAPAQRPQAPAQRPPAPQQSPQAPQKRPQAPAARAPRNAAPKPAAAAPKPAPAAAPAAAVPAAAAEAVKSLVP